MAVYAVDFDGTLAVLGFAVVKMAIDWLFD